MNVQVLADPAGRLLRASPTLPGSAHDLTAARSHGIIDALTAANIPCWADKAYRGAGGPIRAPYRGKWHKLSLGQQAVNARMPVSAPWANAPSRSRRPGGCCADSAAPPPSSPT